MCLATEVGSGARVTAAQNNDDSLAVFNIYVNGKKRNWRLPSTIAASSALVSLSSEFKVLRGSVECGSCCGQPGAARFSIRLRGILNI